VKVFQAIWSFLVSAAKVIGTITTLVIFGALVWGIAWRVRKEEVPAWVLAVVVGFFLLAAAAVFFAGRRSYRRLPPTAAERAREELGVARTYLRHVTDFMVGLRLAIVEGATPADTVRRLRALRDLVFDAMIQGLNTAPGELIRCALLTPVEENGVTVLRAREHRGHTHRVAHLALGMTSVAGRAFVERRPIYLPDAATSPLVQRTVGGRRIGTLFCLPSYSFSRDADQGAPTGVLSLSSNHDDGFTESDRAFITACADMLSLLEFYIGIFEDLAEPAPPQAVEAPAGGGEQVAELPPAHREEGD